MVENPYCPPCPFSRWGTPQTPIQVFHGYSPDHPSLLVGFGWDGRRLLFPYSISASLRGTRVDLANTSWAQEAPAGEFSVLFAPRHTARSPAHSAVVRVGSDGLLLPANTPYALWAEGPTGDLPIFFPIYATILTES